MIGHPGKQAVRLLYAVIALAAFVDGLDGTIVTTALPDIAQAFGITAADSSWVITVYFLVMAGLILVFGKICDKGALKRVIVLGFATFTVGSLLCAFSWSFPALIAFRAVQGIGAGMLSASGIMIAVKYLPHRLMAMGLSISVLGYSIGGALGPILGGVLTEYFAWEWIFLINVPIGIAGVALAQKAVPKDFGFKSPGFDYAGSALLFIAMISGLYVIESIPSHGFGTVSAVLIAVFAVSAILFIVLERKVSEPVLRLPVFRRPATIASIAVFLLINLCWMGAFYLLPFYMQIVLGYDTMTTGAVLAIQSLVTLVMCVPVGKMIPKKGNRHYVILACVSLVIMSASLVFAGDGSPIPMIISVIFLGVIWGFGGGSFGSRVVDSVPPENKGDASPVVSLVIYLGSAIGSALYSGLFALGSSSSGTPISELSSDVFMSGFTFAMIIGTVISVFALFLSWALNEENAAPEEKL